MKYPFLTEMTNCSYIVFRFSMIILIFKLVPVHLINISEWIQLKWLTTLHLMQPPWEGLIYRDEMARHWSGFQWGVEPIHCWTVDKLLWRQDQWFGICSPWSYLMGFSLKVDWWGCGGGTDDQWTIPTKTYNRLLVTCAQIKLLFSCTFEYCIFRHLIRWLTFPEIGKKYF